VMTQLPISLTVTGDEQFTAAAARATEAADAGLDRELSNAITRAVAGLPQAALDNAVAILPKHLAHLGGGALGPWLTEHTQITQSPHSDVGSVTVTTTAASTHNIALLDEGIVRHPLFGNTAHWYDEKVTAGWWSKPVDAVTPAVEASVTEAVAATARRIEG